MITKRQQNMIRVLLDYHDYISSNKLAQLLNVSPKTIRNEIKIINTDICGFALILSIPSRGLQIEIYNREEFDNWFNGINGENIINLISNPIDRSYYILGLMLKRDNYIKIDDISNILYVDRTSISRSLKYIRNYLQIFDLKMEQKTGKGLKIIGNEFNYRLCMVEYIYHKQGVIITKIGNDKEFINKLKNIIFDDGIVMSERVLTNFIIHLQVQLDRIKDGKFISFNHVDVGNIKNEYEFLVAKDLSRLILSFYNVEMSTNELCYLTIHILGKKNNSTSAIENCVNDQLKDDINSVIEQVFDSINSKFNIDFSNDFYLKKAIGLHIYPMKNRLMYNTYTRNPLINKIKTRYLFAFILSIEAFKELSSDKEYIKIEDEIGYLAIHFQYALERRNRNISKKKVLLVNEFNAALGELLTFEILSEYKNLIVIENTISASEIRNYQLDNYDCIISTVPIVDDINIPIIQISPIITMNDINLLKTFFDRDYLFDIDYFININNIIIVDFENKKSIIDFINKSRKNGNINGFETSKQLAIYYSFVENNDSRLYIYSINKPIVWENKLVKTIFFLELGTNCESLIVSIQNLINNDTIIDSLSHLKNVKEIYNLISNIHTNRSN